MNNKIIIAVIVTAIVSGATGFFGGMKYQQSKRPQFVGRFGQNDNFQGGQSNQGQRPQGFAPVSGTIIKKDDESITVELPDKSSKIVLLSDSTSIGKTEAATKDDLTEGAEVVVFGQQNSDGSITAQNIQLGTNEFRRQFQQGN